MLFAAEVETDTGYFVLVDKSEDSLFERLGWLLDDFIGDEDCTTAIGYVADCVDIDDALDCIRAGQWSYSQRV